MPTENTIIQLLKDIKNLIAKEGNGRNCVGYQTLTVDNTAVVKLTVPSTAMSAEITLESAGSTNASSAARYTLDGSTPVTGGASANGVAIGDFDTIEILGNTNLDAFKVIAVDAANPKYLKVHYFN